MIIIWNLFKVRARAAKVIFVCNFPWLSRERDMFRRQHMKFDSRYCRWSWTRSEVHISCYAIKIPGEIVWYRHYRSSSAFKRHNMPCSFEIFLRKGGRNRRLLLALRNCYFLRRRDNFTDRNLAVYVSTLRTLHVLKMIDFERKLLFSALLTPDFIFRYFDMCMKDTDLLIENNVQPILVFQKTLERKAKCGILLR